MKKLVPTVLLSLVVVFILLLIGKDLLIKIAAENVVRSATGLGLDVKSFKSDFFTGVVEIKGMKVLNPVKFEDRTMLDMPLLYVKADLKSVMSGKAHINDLNIQLDEFRIVKAKDGTLNLDSLKAIKNQKKETQTGQKAKPMPIQIDKMHLKIGKVVYSDYSGGSQPKITEYNIGLDENFSNITDLNALTGLIVLKALQSTPLGRLLNLDLGALQSTVNDTLSTARTFALDSAKEAQGIVSDVASRVVSAKNMEDVGGAVQGATEDLGKAADKIAGAIKFPFGGSDK